MGPTVLRWARNSILGGRSELGPHLRLGLKLIRRF